MNKQTSQVYADYYTVIPQINYYYYTMLDYYRVYLEMRLNGKDNKRMITRIQGIMCILYDLVKHYQTIKKKEDELIDYGLRSLSIKEIFHKFELMNESSKRINFEGITLMKDTLVKCYHILGLSDIEQFKDSNQRPSIPFEE